MKELKKFMPMIRRHRLLFSLAVLIMILVIGGLSYVFISGITYSRTAAPIYESEYERGTYGAVSPAQQAEEAGGEVVSESTEYKIKKGSASIKSTDAASDYEKVRQKTESLDGWVETMDKSEDYKEISIRTDLKIPSESFDSFADWMMNNLDVESSSLEFYKETVEKEQDEIQILLEALNVYDRLLEKAEAMNVSETSINIVMFITEQKLEVMRLLKLYGYTVEEVKEKAKYASLSITLTQQKKIELMPEDVGREFMTRLRNSISDIVSACMDLVTVPIVIFVNIVVWIIYAIIVLIPLFIAYRILSRIFKKIGMRI